ncbi:MAG: energy transducer TonB [Candidatus Cloacimonetes bacterium]|nr:energy transducer TonB [Candidatus Cloacimonadota bacterium]
MKDRNVGAIISILMHLILILAAVYIKFLILPESAYRKIEFIEFGFNESPNNEKFISQLSQSSQASSTQNIGGMSNIIPKKVNMPKSFSESEESVYVPVHEKIALNQLDINNKIGASKMKLDNEINKEFIDTANLTPVNEPTQLVNDDYLTSLTNRLLSENNSESSFILEGEITNRKIVHKVIPTYPENVQKSIKIKIKFDVLPDGSVTNIIIVQKAEPKMELNSLNALSKWKFNALNQDIVQKGMITFIYELK